MAETAMDYLSENSTATFSSSETKWINKIQKLANEYPDEVNIMQRPDDNQGYLVAHIPKSWFKVAPPRKCNYTEEQRAAMAERLAAARNKKGD